jgi:hypothetical protein
LRYEIKGFGRDIRGRSAGCQLYECAS